jgi:hypothetical protein
MVKPAQEFDFTILLAPITAATAARSVAMDTLGADYATILITLGAEANTNSTNVTLQLAESDNSTTGFVTFNSNFNRVADNTAAMVVVYHLDLKGRARYVRLSVTPDTSANGAVISSAISMLDLELSNVSSTSNGDLVVVG